MTDYTTIMEHGSKDYFHPLINTWFHEKYGTPSDAQAQAWPRIIAGEHVLVSAPTGSGKTLTAFLGAIDALIRWPRSTRGVRILYISPLKALNNDIQHNLLEPLAELKAWWDTHAASTTGTFPEQFPRISVMTRSGDSSPAERRAMVHSPPDILITTPESLNLLLTSRSGRSLLSSLDTLILDEIHALAGNKRGVHLISAVERLTLSAGEFQRIGLSATVRPLETIASWLGGFKQTPHGGYTARPVSIVISNDRKEINLNLKTIQGELQTSAQSKDTWWDALAHHLVDIIRAQRSTLIFTNSRRMAEKLTRYINEVAGELIAYSHHGSLSKEIRLSVEQRLKAGELKALVATSSLELGIDIGSLDRVIMVQAPFSVSSALQRVGRAGHRLGVASEADLIPMHGLDTVNAVVMAQMIKERSIEAVKPVENPLDILAQILLSMMCRETWNLNNLYQFIRTCWPYRNLDRKFFDLTIDMLSGRYADAPVRDLRSRLEIDVIEGTATARDGSDFLLYQSGGTIPDRGYFHLRLASDKSLIGELDEQFVWERQLGDQFTLGTNSWQILGITQNDVEVQPADPNRSIIPFWKAEDLNQDFFLASRVSDFLETANQHLDTPNALEWVSSFTGLDTESSQGLIRFLNVQRSHTGTALPSRHHIVIEEIGLMETMAQSTSRKTVVGHQLPTRTQVVIHTLWGGRLNKPFALAMAAVWEEKFNSTLEFYAGNECILLELPDVTPDSQGRNWSSVELVKDLVTSKNIESFLRKKLEHTGIFAAHFRENSARALLLPRGDARRRFPLWLNRLRSKKLLEAVSPYPNFPMVVETWRECLEDEFDVANLKLMLDEIASGVIEVSRCVCSQPSPFANNVVWQQTNFYMYEGDTPASTISGLSDDMYQQLLADARLRPQVSAAVAAELESKLLSLWPGYAPRTPGDLVAILNEQGIMSAELWDMHCRFSAAEAGTDPYFERDLSSLSRSFARFRPIDASIDWIVSLPQLPSILLGLGYTFDAPPTDLPQRVKDWLRSLDTRTQLETAEVSLSNTVGGAAEAEPIMEAENHPALAREGLLHRWLMRRGPVSIEDIHKMFGWPQEGIVSILDSLEESGRLVSGLIIKDDIRVLYCESENYEHLLRIMRQSSRVAFTSLSSEVLPVFIAEWQGLLSNGNDVLSLQEHLDRLFAYPLPAGYWERIVFPTRMRPYQSAWLDSLFVTKGLAWFGCGAERISFAFTEDLDRYRLDSSIMKEEGDDELLALLPESDLTIRPKLSLLDLARINSRDSAAVTSDLWRLAWQGQISVDSFEAIRRGIASGFVAELPSQTSTGARGGFKRWEQTRPLGGGWFRISSRKYEDAMEQLEWSRESVSQVLRRYGVVFREILQQEIPQLRWKELFRTLRIMELSGEVITGRFFEGIAGIQFASPLAFRRLQQAVETGDLQKKGVWWINAIDPASLCGLGLAPEENTSPKTKSIQNSASAKKDLVDLPLPRRLASNWIVYAGTRVVMIARRNGKDIELVLEPSDALLDSVMDFFPFMLSCSHDASSPLVIETINGASGSSSPWIDDFRRAGFQSDYRNLMLWKKF